jgi:hypothetical protein
LAITSFKNEDNQALLNTELIELFQQLSETMSLGISIAPIVVQSDSLANVTISFKTNSEGVTIGQSSISKYEEGWPSKARAFGLPENCLHSILPVDLTSVKKKNKMYEIMGISSLRRRKYPVVIKDVETGKLWKVTIELLKKALHKAGIQTNPLMVRGGLFDD